MQPNNSLGAVPCHKITTIFFTLQCGTCQATRIPDRLYERRCLKIKGAQSVYAVFSNALKTENFSRLSMQDSVLPMWRWLSLWWALWVNIVHPTFTKMRVECVEDTQRNIDTYARAESWLMRLREWLCVLRWRCRAPQVTITAPSNHSYQRAKHAYEPETTHKRVEIYNFFGDLRYLLAIYDI